MLGVTGCVGTAVDLTVLGALQEFKSRMSAPNRIKYTYRVKRMCERENAVRRIGLDFKIYFTKIRIHTKRFRIKQMRFQAENPLFLSAP